MKTGGIVISVIGIALFSWHLIRVSSDPDYIGYASHQVMSVNGVIVMVFGMVLDLMGTWRNERKEKESRKLVLMEEKMATHKDPVCGMQVEESEAAGNAVYEGTTYYFCSTSCKEKFETSPEDYVDQ